MADRQTVHIFDSTGSAYDACQCDENIKTGDVLFIPSEQVIGLAWAWPVAVTAQCGAFHQPKTGTPVEAIDNGLFLPFVAMAREWCDQLGYAQ